MDVPYLKIGAKINIISKANVRYEGFLVEVDTNNLQIALSDVRFFGTESRAAEVHIAGQERVYPYVIFKSTDIKDIRVMNEYDEIEQPLTKINGFVRRDYPQSTLEFLRNFPFAQIKASQNVPPIAKRLSSLERGTWTRNRGGRRLSPYMWRIPRVVDFIGRSGDPNELPVDTNEDNFNFEQEYDFEKNNKLFEDLVKGIKELNLSFASSDDLEKDKDKENTSESSQSEQQEEQEPIKKIEEVAPTISRGATPKKYEVYKSKPTPSAYNKAKSFFDTVSCSSIYRSPNSNPNWREWNKETFGIPMIRHQRRKRRSVLNGLKTNEGDGKNFEKNTEKITTNGKDKCVIQAEENVTVQKIRFQAVVVTKTRGASKTYEKNCKDESSNAFEIEDVDKYSFNTAN